MGRSIITLLLALGGLFMAAACNTAGAKTEGQDGRSAAPRADQLVMTITNSGGCDWGGHCTRSLFYAGGAFEISPNRRTTLTNNTVTGSVAKELVTDLISHAEALDWTEFTSALPPGAFRAPVDGIDVLVTIHTSGTILTLDSTRYGFDPKLPLFQMISALQTAARDAQRPE